MMSINRSFFFLLLLLASCTKEVKQQHAPELPLAQGVSIELSSRPRPKVTYLSNTPSPKRQAPWKPIKQTPQGHHVVMETYGSAQGAQSDAFLSIKSDSLGNLWLGAGGNGVTRYDGTGFSNFDGRLKVLSRVFTILEDKDRNLWFGTDVGLTKYDGMSLVSYANKSVLGDSVLCSLQDKKGQLWFGTDRGISIFSGRAIKNISTKNGLIGDVVNALYEDNHGAIWIGTSLGLSRYDGKSFKNFSTDQGLVSNNILSIGAEKDGTLWVGTDQGAARFDGDSFTSYTAEHGLAGNFVRSIYLDRSGRLWLGTSGGLSGVTGNAFTNISEAQGLCSNNVTGMTDDARGNLWIATLGGGICRYDGQAFSNFAKPQGLPALVYGFLRSKINGLLWLGTRENGVISSDGKTWTEYQLNQGGAGESVYALYEDRNGALWFGTTNRGVSKFDGNSLTTFTTQQGLAGNDVKSILQDKSGMFWFGTTSGLSKFDGKSFTNFTTEQGLAGNIVWGINQDKAGNLWFATYGGGVSRYNGKSFTNFTTAQGLPTNHTFNTAEDDAGTIWITTSAGLVRYDGHSFLTYSVEDGLSDYIVFRSTIMPDGNLIFNSEDGLSVLRGFSPKGQKPTKAEPAQNKLSNVQLQKYDPIFDIYSQKTGYPIVDSCPAQYGLYRDFDGTIWNAGGSDKIVISHIDFSAIRRSEAPPILVIKAIDVNNTPINWSSIAERFSQIKFNSVERFYPVPRGLRLPHIHNNVTFHFAAVEPALPENVSYQFMLQGYDEDWSPVTKQRQASFGNIFEGTYTFKVKAQSPFGVWSAPTTYTFTVLPPWYRTWWAYLIYSISSLLFLFGIYRWRTAALRKHQKLLAVLYAAAERFVPKAFLSQLGRHNIQDVKLGDSIETNLTVLFSDIRSYTTLAERLSPNESYAFINSYWNVTAPIIDQHQGFISQYLGDGVMALFPKHPDDAVEAVLDMMDALDAFNAEQAKVGGHVINTGYGLSSGPAMLGTIGVQQRMDANVISNTSNLASRVENLNKFYGTRFLVTSLTYWALSDPSKYTVRFVDKIRVKGMHNTVKILEIYRRGPISANERSFIDTYERAFDQYEKGDFSAALLEFKKCHLLKPDDQSTQVLMERCETLIEKGAPKDWQGIYEMLHK